THFFGAFLGNGNVSSPYSALRAVGCGVFRRFRHRGERKRGKDAWIGIFTSRPHEREAAGHGFGTLAFVGLQLVFVPGRRRREPFLSRTYPQGQSGRERRK